MSMFKMGGTLFCFCAVSALLLAGFNQMTAPVIAQRTEKANNEARMQVLPQAKEFKAVDEAKIKAAGIDTVTEVFEGIEGSDVVGYTIKSNPKGYGGPIALTIGIDKEGKITGVNVGDNQETPGLGAKATEDSFKGQYTGKEAKPLEVLKSGSPAENQIKAISGATITSKAVTSGVNDAITVFDTLNK